MTLTATLKDIRNISPGNFIFENCNLIVNLQVDTKCVEGPLCFKIIQFIKKLPPLLIFCTSPNSTVHEAAKMHDFFVLCYILNSDNYTSNGHSGD